VKKWLIKRKLKKQRSPLRKKAVAAAVNDYRISKKSVW
jgi:hypothetical protein